MSGVSAVVEAVVPGLRETLAEARAECELGRDDRHKARQVTYGRVLVSGVVSVHPKFVSGVRESCDGDADDLGQLAADLMAAQGFAALADGKIRGPGFAPPPSAPFDPEVVSRLAALSCGEPGPRAAGGVADLIEAGEAYADWLERVREPGYWLKCQRRRAYLFGRFALPDDPRPKAGFVRRYALQAGPRDVAALWSDAALRLDYDRPPESAA